VLIETLNPCVAATATAACKCVVKGVVSRSTASQISAVLPGRDPGAIIGPFFFCRDIISISPDSRLQITFGTELGADGRMKGAKSATAWPCRSPRLSEAVMCTLFALACQPGGRRSRFVHQQLRDSILCRSASV
jgi:hypothetical protein